MGWITFPTKTLVWPGVPGALSLEIYGASRFAIFQAKICITEMGHKGEITYILEFSMMSFICFKNEILLK